LFPHEHREKDRTHGSVLTSNQHKQCQYDCEKELKTIESNQRNVGVTSNKLEKHENNENCGHNLMMSPTKYQTIPLILKGNDKFSLLHANFIEYKQQVKINN